MRIDAALVEIVERCMQSRPVLDHSGQQAHQKSRDGALVPLFTFDARGAIAALRLLGLERGMFRQREIDLGTDLFGDLPAETVEQIRDALAMLGR